ncbi:hypothetical protein Vretimale_17617 [Volvox reticuliferus]|uniref:Uncharacterized protein n=2 Tax=Volvox reticuliferus TaxID=1737510 RepID=A0A8J4CX39_9CHLO|nr:hypothetical protein Vretifemale_18134 [Volvox reticuliferus]GIM14680.1 hypothetical protein Vretimale_17617 [Volvox reticuliferus]
MLAVAAGASMKPTTAAVPDEHVPENRTAPCPEEAAPVDKATTDLVFACWQAMERYAPLPQPPQIDDEDDPSNSQQRQQQNHHQQQLVNEHRLLQELLYGALNCRSDTEAAGACPASCPDESADNSEEHPSAEDGEKEEGEEGGVEPSAEEAGPALGKSAGVSSQPSTSRGMRPSEHRQAERLWKRRRHLMTEEIEGLLPSLPLTESAVSSPPRPPPPLPSLPSDDLQSHLDSVAASLIKRHCTVPVSDPLVTAYGSVCRDAVQL